MSKNNIRQFPKGAVPRKRQSAAPNNNENANEKGSGNSEKFDPNVKIPINPNVKNEELLSKLKDYKADQTVEKLNILITELVKCIVLVPAVINEDNKPNPKLMKTSDGTTYLGIYTDKEQVPVEQREGAVLLLPYIIANDVVIKSNGSVRGVVLNPFTENLILKKELVERIAEVEKKKAELKKAQAQASAAAPVPKTFSMTEKQYNQFETTQFEVGYLPGKLFTEGQQFVDKLAEEKETYIDEMFEDSYKEKRMYPLLPEDFSVMPMSLSENMMIIRIDMPDKDIAPGNAYRIYICWDSASEEGKYYRIVQGKEKKEVFLEEVTKDKKYLRLQDAPVEGTELSTVAGLFGYVEPES